MPRARFHYPVTVISITPSEDDTIIRLDFGHSCFGSLIVPVKIADKSSIKLFLECEAVEDATS
jgi:hypothetical protein